MRGGGDWDKCLNASGKAHTEHTALELATGTSV